ncbi:exosortase/archaeosortase family protein [bacterium]|nr:exosortase/archaeosortase family protein [bacterium]
MSVKRTRVQGVLIPLALLVSLNFLVFWDPLSDMWHIATSRVDSIYLLSVPFVAVYLAWLRQTRLDRYEIQRSLLGPILVLSGWFLFVGGAVYDVVVFWHLGGIVGFIGALVTCVGPRILLIFGPAFFVLFAMAPLPGLLKESIALPLQKFATVVTSIVLETLGVDAIRRGSIIELNGQIVLVGEACNGMRLVMPIAIVMYTVVYSLPLRRAARLLLILASVPIALACNILRLIPTSLAYGFMPERAELIHDIGGWLMLPIAVLLLLGLLRFVEWLDVSVSKWRLVTA